MTPNSPAALALFFGLMAVMVWIVWMGRRREQFAGVSEVSAAEQADLGREARAMYTSPQWKLCNPETPSDFDSTVLSLFHSIEANRDDIDAKLETVRTTLANAGHFERSKDKQKLYLVYRNMAAYLVRSRPGRSRLGMQQLLASWGMVGKLAGGDVGPRRVPDAWIRPLVDDFARGVVVSGSGTGAARGVASENQRVFWIALFVAFTVSAIIHLVYQDLLETYMLMLGIGIFLAAAVALKIQFHLARRSREGQQP
jgi:hypothetical protein